MKNDVNNYKNICEFAQKNTEPNILHAIAKNIIFNIEEIKNDSNTSDYYLKTLFHSITQCDAKLLKIKNNDILQIITILDKTKENLGYPIKEKDIKIFCEDLAFHCEDDRVKEVLTIATKTQPFDFNSFKNKLNETLATINTQQQTNILNTLEEANNGFQQENLVIQK